MPNLLFMAKPLYSQLVLLPHPDRMLNSKLLQLHLIVLINSTVPILAILITLPPIEITFYRTFLAIIFLGLIVAIRKYEFLLPPGEILKIFSSGLLTAIYWILLFLSAKLSNASVSLIGMASTSIWTSLLAPLIQRKRVEPRQLLLGFMAMLGIWIITRAGFEHIAGLLVGISAGFFGSLLTIVNAQFAKNHDYYVITFYQMIGAFIGILLIIPIHMEFFPRSGGFDFVIGWQNMALILLLVILFSIYFYAKLINLMKSLSPYIVTLTANLSPVYGMLIAVLFFGRQEIMSLSFYIGALIIIISVMIYPFLERYSPPSGKPKSGSNLKASKSHG